MRQAVEDLETGAKEPRWIGHAHLAFRIIPSAPFHGSSSRTEDEERGQLFPGQGD